MWNKVNYCYILTTDQDVILKECYRHVHVDFMWIFCTLEYGLSLYSDMVSWGGDSISRLAVCDYVTRYNNATLTKIEKYLYYLIT